MLNLRNEASHIFGTKDCQIPVLKTRHAWFMAQVLVDRLVVLEPRDVLLFKTDHEQLPAVWSCGRSDQQLNPSMFQTFRTDPSGTYGTN